MTNITLTQAQIDKVLAENSGSVATPPQQSTSSASAQTYKSFFGIDFGQYCKGLMKVMTGIVANGIKFRLTINGAKALFINVSAMNGGLYVCTVADALANPKNGSAEVQAKIKAMGLQPTDYAAFPIDNIKSTTLYPVAITAGQKAVLTVTDESGGNLTLNFDVVLPADTFVFSRVDSGSNINLASSFY